MTLIMVMIMRNTTTHEIAESLSLPSWESDRFLRYLAKHFTHPTLPLLIIFIFHHHLRLAAQRPPHRTIYLTNLR